MVKKEDNSWTGYENGQVPFCSHGLPHKTTTNCSLLVCSFDLNKLNDPIVGSLVRSKSRVFNDFIWKFLAKLPIVPNLVRRVS